MVKTASGLLMASREVFESAFTEFGLPEVLRTDNGTPFSGRHGISTLSVWWSGG